MVNITLDENCYLEYIPDQIIPYQNSRYYQKVNLNIHDDATLIYSEVLTPGRIAINESFDYDICYLRTYCKNQNNRFRNLEIMKTDAEKIRKEKPFEFINCKTDQGIKKIAEHIIHDLLLDSQPKSNNLKKSVKIE